MKELHKLITKDIFDCLSEEDAGRLRELRAELHIDDEAYRQMKKMITSREVHERIMEVRKKPSRMIKMMRYAAILILPVAIAVYIFISQGNVIKPEIVVQNRVEEKLPVPVRKQAMLVLEDGSVLQLQRVEGKKEVTSNAITNGNELVYSKKDSSANNVVVEYNTVVVPKGGEYHVMLADGTKVWFNEETQLRFPVDFVGDSREVFLSKGEIYLEVARDEKHPFIVHTENGDIQVLGTEFNVKCLPDKKVATTLVKGSVQVKRKDAEVVLKPNQHAVVGNVMNVITVTEVDVEQYVSWKDGRLVFDNKPLEFILEELGRWYSFDVFYTNKELKEIPYSLNIKKHEDIAHVLKFIERTGKVKFEVNKNTIIVK